MTPIVADVHKLYCDLYGDRIKSEFAAQEIADWLAEFGEPKVLEALQKAWKANVRNPRYAEAIMRDKGNGKKPATVTAPQQGRMERW